MMWVAAVTDLIIKECTANTTRAGRRACCLENHTYLMHCSGDLDAMSHSKNYLSQQLAADQFTGMETSMEPMGQDLDTSHS